MSKEPYPLEDFEDGRESLHDTLPDGTEVIGEAINIQKRDDFYRDVGNYDPPRVHIPEGWSKGQQP